MELLTEDRFLEYKKNDTIVLYGCGSSINKVVQDDLKSFDSIGFNWFCKSGIPVTFYVIREQCVPAKREAEKENLVGFLEHMTSPIYRESCRIVHKAKYLRQKAGYSHFKYHDQLYGKGIIIKDIKMPAAKVAKNRKNIVKSFSISIFDNGVQHGTMTMYNILHIVTHLKYKRIIFVGVDLYDSSYFWIAKGQTRVTVKNKGRTYKLVHVTAKETMRLVNLYKMIYPKIKMYSYNGRSLLTQSMPVWER